LLDAKRDDGIRFFGLDPALDTVLFLGGSQGAKYLNFYFAEALTAIDTALHSPVQILWSAGQQNYDQIKKIVANAQFKNISVHLFPYIERMEYAYAVAKLAIGRAGASTLAEINARGIPAILIPFPYATNNHQLHNALQMEEFGAAEVLEEQRLTKTTFANTILQLLNNPDRIAQMAKQSAALGKPDARKQIATLIVNKLLNNSNGRKLR
jgi:UDP-N-acetylglucosamine--N-acetylmuramyl-(pentapeptide) pyrophosphoryl-undecaprenol N-acetylglucosamine transferase